VFFRVKTRRSGLQRDGATKHSTPTDGRATVYPNLRATGRLRDEARSIDSIRRRAPP